MIWLMVSILPADRIAGGLASIFYLQQKGRLLPLYKTQICRTWQPLKSYVKWRLMVEHC